MSHILTADLDSAQSQSPVHRDDRCANGVGGVVIGGDYQGLGIARSLGRRGLPVCIIDDEHSISRYSRYASHAVRVPSLREERETVDLILDVGRRFDLRGWVLYPTRDETVAALSKCRDVLSEWFRVPTPSWDSIRWVWDKRNTYALAHELGIPTPRTWFPQNIDNLRRIDGCFPLAIKPAIKEHFVYATKAKAWRANTPEELEARFRQAAALTPPGEIMVQDLIPGDGSHQFAYCAFFKQGKPVGTLVAQRCRQHPGEFGRASTFVQTVDMPELELLSERFLRAIDYYGLVELEFKRDPRDGEFKLLDVNARTWGYHGLGAVAGTDFPYLLFTDQMGVHLQPSRARQGVTWLRLLTDLPVGVLGVMRGQLGLGPYLKSVFRSHTEAVFSLDDPIPGIADIALVPYLIYKRGF